MADLPDYGRTSVSPDEAAATWALRSIDGLTAAQQAELSRWLAADPSHPSLLAEHRRTWDRFSPLGSERRARRSASVLRVGFAAMAAAAIALGFWLVRHASSPNVELASLAIGYLPPPCQQFTLDDGTRVELNRGAEVAVEFSTSLRRVRLVRGEAVFHVAKDAARPFVVAAGAIEARAIGTAFHVRFEPTAIEVLVTEGNVQVARATNPAAAAVLKPGDFASVSGDPRDAAPVARALTSAEIERLLAWRPRLLDFDDVPLSEIAAAFSRHNPVLLTILDPELASRRMTASFRSDNVEGFLRLLADNYAIRTTVATDGTLALSSR